jgi:isoleucyl-tRNA synthetase
VDVMRWLFCTHKPENDLLFGYHGGDDVRRAFLIPLWNVYSFFVTYARLDGWTPDGNGASGKFDPNFPEGDTPHSENLLDKWILARLNQVIEGVSAAIEASDFMNASLTAEAFLDDLSNWYVRRSRRRYWKSEHDADKNTAYATLYHVLVKFAKMLAPFVPFVSEVMYQNLVRAVRPEAYESIHHTAWPTVDASTADDALLEQMALAREVSSAGLQLRSSHNLKVRQPLSKVLVNSKTIELPPDLEIIVKDEINVKDFVTVELENELVKEKVSLNYKLVGPKFGPLVQKIRDALDHEDPSKVAASKRAGIPITLEVADASITLSSDEIELITEPLPGLAVSSEKAFLVGIDTTLTPELKAEGVAREIVRRVQDMRKNAGFNIEDRITTCYQAEDALTQVFDTWSEYIKSETLTTQLLDAPPIEGAFVEEHKLEGEKLILAVKQNK